MKSGFPESHRGHREGGGTGPGRGVRAARIPCRTAARSPWATPSYVAAPDGVNGFGAFGGDAVTNETLQL